MCKSINEWIKSDHAVPQQQFVWCIIRQYITISSGVLRYCQAIRDQDFEDKIKHLQLCKRISEYKELFGETPHGSCERVVQMDVGLKIVFKG